MRRPLRFLGRLFFRKRQDAELAEELKFHQEMQTQQLREAGMSEEEAARIAKLKLGEAIQIREEVRMQSPFFYLETIWLDAVYGLRMLRKAPGFTLIAVLTLSISIGACTALFSLLNGILLRPLPYPNPEQLVDIQEKNVAMSILKSDVSMLNVKDWSEADAGMQIAAYYTMGRTLTDRDESQVVLASQVGPDFFRLMGVPALLGHTFTFEETRQITYSPANAAQGSNLVVILSYSLWTTRYGGDRQIVGKTIILERRYWKVVGVMPQSFAFPDPRTALWIPWGIGKADMRDQHFAGCVARLAKNMTTQQAEQKLNAVAAGLALTYPETNSGWQVSLTPLHDALTGNVKRTLWVLLSAVALVLIIACSNIAVLQLSRASARLNESAIRLALGAGRARLIRQFFIESTLLAVAGGLFGIIFAQLGIAWLRHLEPALPRLSEISIDTIVLIWTFAVTSFCVLFFGLGPAVLGASAHFAADGLHLTAHKAAQRFRSALVVLEITFAVVLLCSSGMLIRSFARLQAVNPGFNPHNVLVLPIFLDTEKYNSKAKSRDYYAQLFERLRALPGVEHVGGATALPASPLGPDFERPVWDSHAMPRKENQRFADVRIVTTDYFRTLGMSIVRGRGFSNLDGSDSTPVVIVNQSLSRLVWPAEDAVGKNLMVDYSTSGTYSYQVVGVVNDLRFYGPRTQPHPEIYFLHAQRPYLVLNVAIRTKGDPRLLTGSVRNVLHSLDPLKPPHNITPLEDLVDATMLRDRYAMTLVSGFATAAFTLALLGIYGVLAFYVRQRIREIGIRIALGAKDTQIIRWICRQGFRLLAAGLVAGLLCATIFTRLLSGLLFEVSALDVLSIAGALLVMSVAALSASWIPAHRAARINPAITLRYE